MELGDRIRNRRKEIGMTQAELARRIGVSEASVNRYESGDILNPSLRTLRRLSLALRTSANYLMGEPTDLELMGEKLFDWMDSETSKMTETQAMAEKIYQDKNLRLLFSAAEDATPEDLQLVHDMLKRLKQREQGNDE